MLKNEFLIVMTVLSVTAFSQLPAFDIADIHVSATSSYTAMSRGLTRGDLYELRHANMVELISTAYGVDAGKVLGGPSWMEFDRFDVIAKAPPSTTPANLKLMLQALLADRFKLVLHRDSQPVSAPVLSVGTGKPKLKESDGLGNSGCQSRPVVASPGAIPINMMSCHNVTMEAFAQTLRDIGSDYLAAAIVDQTGLKGGWDFEMQWTSRGLLAPAGSAGITLFEAVDKQLGLKLDERRVAIPTIVVDRAEKPPQSPAGIATNLLTAPPLEFEVAAIKPVAPGADDTNIVGAPFGFGVQSGGRVDIQSATLKSLILAAWNFSNDELLAGGPKWLDTNRWDIVAKASTGVAAGRPDQVDIETLQTMLRNLLIDRFQLKTHMEDRPVNAYTLHVANPKLQKADARARTGCKEGPPPNPIRARVVICTDITMAQFAERLPSIAGGYLQTPVMDMTGLDGPFDFRLNFSNVGVVQRALRGGRDATAGAPSSAADPSDAISLFEAMTKQLGLKLELQKRPLPVLVIDHAEEKPIEN